MKASMIARTLAVLLSPSRWDHRALTQLCARHKVKRCRIGPSHIGDSVRMFAAGETGDINSRPIRDAVASGILTDAVPDVCTTLAQRGGGASGETR
jgi:hypothetical protein